MVRAFVSVFLMFVLWFGFAIHAHSQPSQSQVEEVWESNPEIIISIVQKLYVIENAMPVLTMPDLTIIELDDGSTRVEYSGIMGLYIGNDLYNLSYDIELSPKDVVIGYTPETRFPWGWLAAGAGIAFVGGILVGVLVVHK